MRTVRSATLTAALSLVLGGWIGVSAQVRQVNVQGRIINTEGRRLQGDITVIEAGPGIRVSSYETTAQGAFSFPARPGQSITVVAKADGYISSEKQVTLGQAAPNLEFVLSLAGRVSGRVIDEIGKAIPGAVVRVRYPGRAKLHELGQETGDVATDDFGYFTLPFVERRTPFVVDVAAPHRPITSSLPITLSVESMTGVVITVSGKTQVVRGRVLDSTSQPVSGANVHLRWIGKSENPGEANERNSSLTSMLQANRFASSGRDGSFQFEGVAEGDVIVVARRGSSSPSAVEGTVTGNAPLDVVLILR
jgi:hypothetical protein